MLSRTKGRLLAVIAFIAFVRCDDPFTEVILTTRLRADAPPGQNEQVMYDMCTHLGEEKQRPEDALKVTFIDKDGNESEQIVRCETVRKRFKPQNKN